jgi:hypothetical protein
MASKQRHHRATRHMARRGHMHRHMHAGAGDAATDQLNQQELARIQGGGMPPPPPPAGPGPGGPRPSGH